MIIVIIDILDRLLKRLGPIPVRSEPSVKHAAPVTLSSHHA